MIRIGGSGYSLANLVGLVALVWAVFLAVTSFNRVITFLGLNIWKWVHSFTYTAFYLTVAHIVYFQFFSTYGGEVGPDWFGYMMAIMTAIVVALQFIAFFTVLGRHRKKVEGQ